MPETPDGAAPDSWESIKQWRKSRRNELLERRQSMAAADRNGRAERAKARLLEHVDLGAYAILGIYWPFRGEIDVRDIAKRHVEAGGQVALPVVVTQGAAVEFWRWHPGSKLERGIWNIPIPPERDVVQPDALIIPLVGYDQAGYRLGYGGGYYDRTLAAANPRPHCLGLGYAFTELETIYPQAHDIPMDVIVTDELVRPISQRVPLR